MRKDDQPDRSGGNAQHAFQLLGTNRNNAFLLCVFWHLASFDTGTIGTRPAAIPLNIATPRALKH